MNFCVFISFILILTSSSLFADSLRLALNGKPEPQFGGFYAAEKKGFFRDQGLNVKIFPAPAESSAEMRSSTIQLLEKNQAEYAITSADELILAHDQGAKDIIAIYAAYQTSPQCIMIHAERNLGYLEDVFKASGTLSWQPEIPSSKFLTKKYAPFKVKTAPLSNSIENFQKDPLASQQCLAPQAALTAQKTGLPMKIFRVADNGYNPYATVLITRSSRARNNSLEVQKMVQATRLGWQSYLKDPTETNKLIESLNKTMDLATFKTLAEAQSDLINPQPQIPERLGIMETSRWETLIEELFELKLIKSKPKATELFQNL